MYNRFTIHAAAFILSFFYVSHLSAAHTVELYATDFADGTYRIKNPGTYELKENIVFNPTFGANNSRPDKPINGFWFAAISIESDRVTLKGNGYSISQSLDYEAANKTGFFSTVLLGNNAFAGPLFGVSGARYTDTSVYVAANDVTIENLIMGHSSHFNLRGLNNNNISVNNCEFNDHGIAGVNLQGPVGLNINNSRFRGLSSPLLVSAEMTQFLTLDTMLSLLAYLNAPGAEQQLQKLHAFYQANAARFTAPQVGSSTNYALLIAPGATSSFRFPMNPTTASIAPAFSAGRAARDIQINNCTFENYKSVSHERVALISNRPESPVGVPFNYISLTSFGISGQLEWKDAFDANGAFNPNDYLESIAVVAKLVFPSLPASAKTRLPNNTQVILQSIIDKDETTFFNNVAPLVGLGDDGNFMKGLFGIRIISATNVKINNVKMKDFVAEGPAGIEPSSLVGWSTLISYQPNITTIQPIIRFRGNDAWFFSFEVCDNVDITNTKLENMTSMNGYSFGVDLPSGNSNFSITNVDIKNMSSPNTVATSVTNLGDVFGFNVQNELGPIELTNVNVTGSFAGGELTSFPAPSTTIILKNAKEIP